MKTSFFFQAEDGIRGGHVTGVQTCALPICYALTGKELQTINDHPKINIDPQELQRINRNFIDYQGNYPKVEYINSMGHLQKRDYFYLNMSKLTAEYLAGLVFNEQCEINISDADDDKETNTY